MTEIALITAFHDGSPSEMSNFGHSLGIVSVKLKKMRLENQL